MDRDYPLSSRVIEAKFYRRATAPRTINRVVIHITDGGADINGTIGWFQNPSREVSAHYIVGQDGEIVQMVRDNDVAFHAGSANSDSVGIEHVARAAGEFNEHDPGLQPTVTQYESSAALVRWLCEQYNIPMDRDHILGHSEADPNTTHKDCPNAVWNWDYYMDLIKGAMCVSPNC